MRATAVTASLLGLGLLLVTSTAVAQPAQRSRHGPRARTTARAHPARPAQPTQQVPPVQDAAANRSADLIYEAGLEARDEGDYESALGAFETAFQLNDAANILFDIGDAAERLEEDARALVAYQAYLLRLPEAENRETVERRIRVLQIALGQGEPSASEAGEASGAFESDSDYDDGRPSALPGLLVGGIGLAIVTAGVVTLLLAESDAQSVGQARDAVAAQCESGELPGRTCHERQSAVNDEIDGFRSLRTAGWIVTGIGAATLVAAGLLLSPLAGGDDAYALNCAAGLAALQCRVRF